MKKRKILYFLPVFSLLLTGCDFASIMDKAKDLGGKIVNPIKDLINPDKEGDNGEGGGNQEGEGGNEEGGGGEEQQVVAVSIKELIGVPAEIVQGETLAASSLKATVIYSDNTSKTEDVTKVELDTSKVGEATGKAYVNALVKEFTINVKAKEEHHEDDEVDYGTEENPLSVTKAVELIQKECKEDGDMTKQAITLVGEVSEIKNTFTYPSGPCFELYLVDGTSTAYFYRVHATEEQAAKVAHGAVVKAVGYAKNYKGTLEFVDNGDDAQCHMLSVVASEVTITSIKGVTGPETIEVGETLDLTKVKVSVVYSDGTEAVIAPDSVDLNTEEAGVQTAVVHVGQLIDQFSIEVIEKQADPVKGVYFHKISSQEELIEGNYLIESNSYVFDGQDVAKTCPKVSITNNYILGDEGMAAIHVAAVEGGYTLKVLTGANKGSYLSPTASGNGLVFSESPVVNAIAFNNGVPSITCDGRTFAFNKADNQLRFRYFGSAQQPVALYVAGEAPAPVDPVLTSISATMSTVEYTEGDQLSLEGLVVTGHYDNGSEAVIEEDIVTSLEAGHVLALTDTVLTVSVGELSCDIALTVKEKVVMTSISADMTSKIYTEGDTLSLAGLVVKGHYSDGTEAEISEGYTTSLEEGAELSVENTEVVVYFETFTASISIVVNAKQEEGAVLESISLSDDKVTVYHVGDELIKPTVTAHFDKGDDQIVEGKFDGFNSSAASEKLTITVSYTYEGVTKSVTYDVEIREIPVLDKIEISGEFETEYTEGEIFNKEGVVVTAIYTSDGEPVDVTADAVFPTDALVAGQETIIVSYLDKTVDIEITVAKIPPVIAEGNYFMGVKAASGNVYLQQDSVSTKSCLKGVATSEYDSDAFTVEPDENDANKCRIVLTSSVSGEKQYLYNSSTSANTGLKFGSNDTAKAFAWNIINNGDGSYKFYHEYTNSEEVLTKRYLEYYADANDFRTYIVADAGGNFTNPSDFVLTAGYLPSEIKVDNAPTAAYKGEKVDFTSMVVSAKFGEEFHEVKGYEVDKDTLSETGSQDITVSFKGLTKVITLEVSERVLTGIEVTGDLTNKEVDELGTWDFAGLVTKGLYEGGAEDEAFENTHTVVYTADKSPKELLAAGGSSITVTATYTPEGGSAMTSTIVITGLTVIEAPKNVDSFEGKDIPFPASGYAIDTFTGASDAVYNVNSCKSSTAGAVQLKKGQIGVWTAGNNRNIRSIAVEFTGSASTEIRLHASNEGYSTERTSYAKTDDDYFGVLTIDSESKVFTIPEGTNVRNFALYVYGAAAQLSSLVVTYDEEKLVNVVDSVSLNQTEATLHVGDTLQLEATVEGLGDKDGIVWSSSNEEIATVSDSGLVTAVAASAEPVTITATSALDGTKSATCVVTVNASRSFTTLSVEGGFATSYTTEDKAFANKDLKVYANYDNGDKEEVTDYTVTWSETFNNAAGSHSSTPTLHWDGHDLALNSVTYSVEQAATKVKFTFGAQITGTPSHSDGKSATEYSSTVSDITLSITNGAGLYIDANDAKGNKALKIGTSGAAGSFTIAVPSGVTKVIVYCAGYKAKASGININGEKTATTTQSDDGEYVGVEYTVKEGETSITISSYKPTSGDNRLMINAIEFVF